MQLIELLISNRIYSPMLSPLNEVPSKKIISIRFYSPFNHQFLLTVTAILIQLLIYLFHPLDVDARALTVVHHRQRVFLADDALGGVLYTKGRVPGLVNVPGWEVLQHRQVASDRGNNIDFISRQ